MKYGNRFSPNMWFLLLILDFSMLYIQFVDGNLNSFALMKETVKPMLVLNNLKWKTQHARCNDINAYHLLILVVEASETTLLYEFLVSYGVNMLY